ncbi:hypothetical protein C9439_05600 [archaeon SCG-AAA382B04]|nr:hypothetical protein C9439_05600 [archaeon SCG-AAA382B04]
MVALHDTDHNINWANKAYAESMGTSKKNIIGKKCYEVWLGKDEPCNNCPVQKAMDKGELDYNTKRYLHFESRSESYG